MSLFQHLVVQHAGLFFLPMAARLVNDESAKCRKLVALAIKSLLVKVCGNASFCSGYQIVNDIICEIGMFSLFHTLVSGAVTVRDLFVSRQAAKMTPCNRARKSRRTLQNIVRIKVFPEQFTRIVNTFVIFKK